MALAIYSANVEKDDPTIVDILLRIFLVFLLFLGSACDTVLTDDPQLTDDSGIDRSAECNRDCLIDTMTSYLDAMTADDPFQIHVSESLKYTEDGTVLNLGEGLWQTAESVEPGTRLDFADPRTGQVGSQLVINERKGTRTSPVIYQVRLKVEGNTITEIESVALRRWDILLFSSRGMVPRPVFLQPVNPETRMTREELLDVVGLYMDYLEGTIPGWKVPFDTYCARYENGMPMAYGKLSFHLQSVWRFDVTRRYLVVDEEAGIVWGMFPFTQGDKALVVGEAFKIIDGEIMMIQAVMKVMPAKTWE